MTDKKMIKMVNNNNSRANSRMASYRDGCADRMHKACLVNIAKLKGNKDKYNILGALK